MNDAPAANPPAAAPTPDADPLVGQVFHERFKITGLLARGGMGRVYRAEQAPLGRLCAIKVLSLRGNEDDNQEEFQQRFFMEASTCARLTHPNTVTIFDYGRTDDGVYYMAMELLEGLTLQKQLQTDGRFDEVRTIHIARQIARSLREAHSLGVIHRDLKPANVFLVQHGDEADVVKVLDFGLVKSIDAEPVEELTQAGLFMGSPKYMAPEQVQGEHVDARTDVYAMGVVMFEMITGRVPFERGSALHTVMAHVNEPAPKVRTVAPDANISIGLEAVIDRCLAKNPNDRFASMEELLSSLKQTDGNFGTLMINAAGSISGSGPRAMLGTEASLPPTTEASSARPSGEGDAASAPKPKGRGLMIGAAVALALVASVALAMKKPAEKESSAQAATKVEAPVKEAPKVAAPAPTPVAPAPVPSVAVKIDSDPTGAKVQDDQHAVLCDKTPCTVQVGETARILTVTLDGYDEQKVRIERSSAERKIALTKKAAPQQMSRPATASKPADKPAEDPTWKPSPY